MAEMNRGWDIANDERQTGGLTRRGFLRGAFGACAACVAGPSAFAKPTLALKHDPTLVAFLSDCHVGAWHSPDYQPKRFAACIARVLARDPLPARMFILGDLAYLWGRKEDYALSKKLLQPVIDAGIELTIGMGNHDRRENFLEFWPEYASRSPVAGRIVSRVRGIHFDYIMLDTLDQPEATDKWITPGKLDEAQREWLRAECAAARRPLLVLAHHPANELGFINKPPSSKSAQAFGNVILGANDAPTACCGYIHGHDHTWYVTRDLRHWSSPDVGQTVSLPSTGHWGDIGYALLREAPGRAVLALAQDDYFSPKPLKDGEPPRADWQAIVRDHQGARCTFVARNTPNAKNT